VPVRRGQGGPGDDIDCALPADDRLAQGLARDVADSLAMAVAVATEVAHSSRLTRTGWARVCGSPQYEIPSRAEPSAVAAAVVRCQPLRRNGPFHLSQGGGKLSA